jgi:hypothetical protein
MPPILHISRVHPLQRWDYFSTNSPSPSSSFIHLCVRRSSLCLSETSELLIRDCREHEGERSTPSLQLPPLCADWCAVWRCHAAGGLDSSSCLVEPFESVVLTSLMSAHNALNWLWHLSPIIPLTRFRRCPRSRCCGWSAAARPVINVLFTSLKTADWANIYAVLTIRASQTSMNLYRTGAFRSNKFSHHSLPSTYVHNIRHFALVPCWMQVTDWSANDPGRAGHCRYQVGKARSYPAPHL